MTIRSAKLSIVAGEDALPAIDLAGPPVIRRIRLLHDFDLVTSRE